MAKETREISVLYVGEKDMAKIEDAVGEGREFAAIAKEHKLRMTSLKVDLDAKELDGEVIAEVFATPVGRSSDVMANGKELIMFKVEAVNPPAVREFAAVRQEIERKLMQEHSVAATRRLADEVADAVREGKPVKTARTIATSRANSKDYPVEMAKAAQMQVGEVAKLDTAQGVRVIKLRKITPPARVAQAEQAKTRAALARELAEDMSSQLLAALSANVNIALNNKSLADLVSRYQAASGEE
jgi:hypothetical protein